jgi:drug/metabolite transporter (DMT)-like permease
VPTWLWAALTICATAAQTLRNVMQRGLTKQLGTVGATHVRFLFGLPFGLLSFAVMVGLFGVPPVPTARVLGWALFGALTQIGATALMLAAMKEHSFVVVVVYTKSEPVQVALFGLLILGDAVTGWLASAILIATIGVLCISWPGGDKGGERFAGRAVAYGIGSGGLFALSAVGFRAAIQALAAPSFVLGATTVLAMGLSIQTVLLSSWLAVRSPAVLGEIVRAWRPSLLAGLMGATASQMWFLAFALQTAARVRTLGLTEILFSMVVSRSLLKQPLTPRETAGVALVAGGVYLLVTR